MPVFDVAVTIKAFKRLPDESQIAVERLLGSAVGIVAAKEEGAIAIAARGIPEQIADEETLGSATFTVRKL